MLIKEYIKNNPYRVLGVVANDSPATLMSHYSQMKAFSFIGKSVSFPQDFDRFFGEKPERHPAALDSALAALSTPEGRLRHAMFWFVNDTATDAEALTVLAQSGSPSKALRVWEKAEGSFSAAHNMIVCNLLMGPSEYPSAVFLACLYYDFLGEELASSVRGGFNGGTNYDVLMSVFLDEIVKSAEGDFHCWDEAVKIGSNGWLDELWPEAKAKPLLEQLQEAFNVAISTERLTPQDLFDMARRLMNQAEPLLKSLKAMTSAYPKLLSRYSTIADTIAEKVLDWEITYWNHTPWDLDKEDRVLPLQRFCYRYACSVRLKNRCQKNINVVLGREEDARLFPNGMPDNLVLESDRKKRNTAISGIIAALGERNA